MLERLQIPFVLLLDLPVLELATMFTIALGLSDALADSGADFGAGLGGSVEIGRQRLALLGLNDLGHKGCDLKLSRTSIL